MKRERKIEKEWTLLIKTIAKANKISKREAQAVVLSRPKMVQAWLSHITQVEETVN